MPTYSTATLTNYKTYVPKCFNAPNGFQCKMARNERQAVLKSCFIVFP